MQQQKKSKNGKARYIFEAACLTFMFWTCLLQADKHIEPSLSESIQFHTLPQIAWGGGWEKWKRTGKAGLEGAMCTAHSTFITWRWKNQGQEQERKFEILQSLKTSL